MNVIDILVLVAFVGSIKEVCRNITLAFSGYENSRNNKFIDIVQSILLILSGIFYCGSVVVLIKTLPNLELFLSQSLDIQIVIIFIPPLIAMYLLSGFASKQAVNYSLKKGLIKKTDVKKKILPEN